MSWYDKLIEGNVVRERSYTRWNDFKPLLPQKPAKTAEDADKKKEPNKIEAKQE